MNNKALLVRPLKTCVSSLSKLCYLLVVSNDSVALSLYSLYTTFTSLPRFPWILAWLSSDILASRQQNCALSELCRTIYIYLFRVHNLPYAVKGSVILFLFYFKNSSCLCIKDQHFCLVNWKVFLNVTFLILLHVQGN